MLIQTFNRFLVGLSIVLPGISLFGQMGYPNRLHPYPERMPYYRPQEVPQGRSVNVIGENDPVTEKINQILFFWFGDLPNPSFFPASKIPLWEGSKEGDLIIEERFKSDYQRAASGQYDDWRKTPYGRLALIIILDQFSRRLYPNQPQMLATDAMARGLALEGVQQGADLELFPVERIFFYMPIQHAEDLRMQDYSVKLYRELYQQSPLAIKPITEEFLKLAISHQETIKRFGRFPHRNALLGRESTPEEKVYLAQKRAFQF